MVQYEIDNGSIRVLYGSDEVTGVFLKVIDRRLEWKEEASEEANKLVEGISMDGGGHYLSLNTSGLGIGKKVSKSTMADFMGRYGVPKTRIDELLESKENSCTGPNNLCVCKKITTKRCSNCKWKFYCSKECQQANWPRHKHFCAIKVPEKRIKETSSQKSVYGVLLMPEKEAKPKFVEITVNLKVEVDEEDGDVVSFWKLALDEYFHGEHCVTPRQWGGGIGVRSGVLSGADVREHNPTHMENTLQFYHRDNFLYDGSKLNECVCKITGGKAAHRWAGPMLVMKVQKKNSPYEENAYMDMKLEDCEDMVDFFSLYGK